MKASRASLEEFYRAYIAVNNAKAGTAYKVAQVRLINAIKKVREENG